MDWAAAKTMLSEINTYSQQVSRTEAIACLQLLLDRCYSTGNLRKSRWLDHVEDTLVEILRSSVSTPCENFVGQKTPGHRPEPENTDQAIVIDARPYPIEGQDSLARELVELHSMGSSIGSVGISGGSAGIQWIQPAYQKSKGALETSPHCWGPTGWQLNEKS